MMQAVLVEPRAVASMTLKQWGNMPEDEPGELVDGRLVEEEMAGYAHEAVVVWLILMLGNWLKGRHAAIGGSDAKFAVKPRRGRKADLSVYLPGSPKPPRTGVVRVPPDILVEVVSPSPKDAKRDRVEKLDEYAAFGASWYWIVDPALRTFEIFELGADKRYIRALGRSEGLIEVVPGCKGLLLDLDDLWAEIDALGPAEPKAENQEEQEQEGE